jgi:hypothetical protein
MPRQTISIAVAVTSVSLLIFRADIARSEQRVLTIRVVDRGQDDAAIPGATVKVLEASGREIDSGITDAAGVFTVSGVQSGQFIKIEYSKLGYVRNPDSVAKTIGPSVDGVVGPLIRADASSLYYRNLGVRLARMHPREPTTLEGKQSASDDTDRVNALLPTYRDFVVTTLLAERQSIAERSSGVVGARPSNPPSPALSPPSFPDAPAARAPAAGGASLESDIQETLARYQAAYRALDVSAIRSVFPSVDVAQLQRTFRGLRTINVDLRQMSVSRNGSDQAVVRCLAQWTYVRESSKVERTPPQSMTFTMRRVGSGWLIESIRSAPA